MNPAALRLLLPPKIMRPPNHSTMSTTMAERNSLMGELMSRLRCTPNKDWEYSLFCSPNFLFRYPMALNPLMIRSPEMDSSIVAVMPASRF